VLAICSVLLILSCKSSKDNAYKNAYEEARIAENQEMQNGVVEIAPVASSTTKDMVEDTTFRTEKVIVASGNAGLLKDFSVVCGSFSTKNNADNLCNSLLSEGYSAFVVQNPETGMYRVICASFDTKEEAASSRTQFKAAHPNNRDFQKAWLLYNK
jgi:cell division septation protein DedD